MRKVLAMLALVLAAAPFDGRAAAPASMPIVLDTDIGTDIDDAFALALILRSPELDLVGVTTVSGDTQARARLAAKMLWDAGRRAVPVAAGEPGKRLPIEQCRWAEGFTSPALTTQAAVEFLMEQIEKRPGEITLVPIGPLTNVGTLLKRDPEVAKKIKRIVMMGGSIVRGYEPGSGPAAEYNIAQDPAAAQVVFSSGVPILMVPLDVTAMLGLYAEGRDRIFTHLTPLTNDLTILYHLWDRPTPILFDPMAVAMLTDPSLCETQPLPIEVDDKGFTRVVEGKAPNAAVAVRTDPKKFINFYLNRQGARPRKFGQTFRAGQPPPLLVGRELRFDPIVDPVRVPPLDRVDGNSIEQHREVDVVATGESGLPAAADFLIALHRVACLNGDGAHVAVKALEAATVVDHHRVAENPQEPGKCHDAVVGRSHGHLLDAGEIKSQVRLMVDDRSVVKVGAVVGKGGLRLGGEPDEGRCP
ncbi:MAG: nucleoside hydrolase [Acidobacteriia bacterium]|nr:nucleoside hydrolase [Terriglobia bacterium]